VEFISETVTENKIQEEKLISMFYFSSSIFFFFYIYYKDKDLKAGETQNKHLR
jgi:hypothetical protein